MTESTRQPVAHWRAAEERLCGLVMGAPELYEHCLLAVRRVADELREHRSVEALTAAYRDAPAFVSTVLRESPPAVETLAGAAWLTRYRELVNEARTAARRTRLDEARREGRPWVSLTDEPLPSPPVVQPYERIDMRLADGASLRAFIDIDPDSYGPVYGIELIGLDPANGRALSPEPRWRRLFDSRLEWKIAMEDLRQGLDEAGSSDGSRRKEDAT